MSSLSRMVLCHLLTQPRSLARTLTRYVGSAGGQCICQREVLYYRKYRYLQAEADDVVQNHEWPIFFTTELTSS